MPVFQCNGLAAEPKLKTGVLDLAVIRPIVVDTTDGVLETLQSQQVLGVVDIVVHIHAQTVLEEMGLQTDIVFRGGLPLDLLVTHIGELHTDLRIVVAHGVERGAGSIVADAVVTAHIETCVQTEVVDTGILREPLLVSQHPAQLHTGEDGPLGAEGLHAALGIGTETAVSLCQYGYGSEILVHVVVIAGEVPLHILPHIVGTGHGRIDIVAGSHLRVLVVLALGRIFGGKVAVVVREIIEAETCCGSDGMSTELLIPVDVGVAQDVGLLGEDGGRL